MKTLRKIAAYFLAILGVVLVILKIKQGDVDEADVKDAYLEGREDAIDGEIEKIEGDLGKPVEDLPEDKVADYWEDL